MPAIQPVRLSAQIDELVSTFDAPLAFSRAMHELLNFYADRTLRSSQVIEAAPLLHSYRITSPVMRQIERTLQVRIDDAPDQALILADQLWSERWLETRLLAITIVGNLPGDFTQEIISRITAWGTECKEDKVLRSLLSKGLAHIRLTAFDEYLALLESWLLSPDSAKVYLGIHALPALLKIESFENLPLIFRWLMPQVREINSAHKNDLIYVIRLLIQRSPQETAYFLRQALNVTVDKQTSVLIRRVLDDFPESLRQTLHETLRASRL